MAKKEKKPAPGAEPAATSQGPSPSPEVSASNLAGGESDELKVVVALKGYRAIISVGKPDCDPVIVMTELTQEGHTPRELLGRGHPAVHNPGGGPMGQGKEVPHAPCTSPTCDTHGHRTPGPASPSCQG